MGQEQNSCDTTQIDATVCVHSTSAYCYTQPKDNGQGSRRFLLRRKARSDRPQKSIHRRLLRCARSVHSSLGQKSAVGYYSFSQVYLTREIIEDRCGIVKRQRAERHDSSSTLLQCGKSGTQGKKLAILRRQRPCIRGQRFVLLPHFFGDQPAFVFPCDLLIMFHNLAHGCRTSFALFQIFDLCGKNRELGIIHLLAGEAGHYPTWLPLWGSWRAKRD